MDQVLQKVIDRHEDHSKAIASASLCGQVVCYETAVIVHDNRTKQHAVITIGASLQQAKSCTASPTPFIP